MLRDKRQRATIILGFVLLALLTQCAPPHGPEANLAVPSSDGGGPHTLSDEKDSLIEPGWMLSTYPQDNATIYLLAVPQNYPVGVAQSTSLQTVEAFAAQTEAIAVLNGGFFDPQNAQTTSHVWIDGNPVANPVDNQRLVGNPDLEPYLDQILNRSEFRRYDCDQTWRYDITLHSASVPVGCSLVDAIGAGPQLLPQNLSEEEGFIAYANGSLIRDAIGSQQRNARSAVGLMANGQVVFVVAAQTQPDDGMTLAELATFMAEHGIVKALNLDGGSSSSLVFEGDAYYGRLDAEGRTIQRPIKSVLWVKPLQ